MNYKIFSGALRFTSAMVGRTCINALCMSRQTPLIVWNVFESSLRIHDMDVLIWGVYVGGKDFQWLHQFFKYWGLFLNRMGLAELNFKRGREKGSVKVYLVNRFYPMKPCNSYLLSLRVKVQ